MPTIKKISDLADGGELLEGDIIPILRNGVNLKVAYPDVISYGEIYFDSATPLVTTLTTAGTFYPIVSKTGQLLQPHLIKNITTNLIVGEGSFVAEFDGIYRVNYSVSYSSNGPNYTYQAALFVNGTRQPEIASYRKVTNASTVLATSSCGIIQLTAGDILDLRFACDTNAAEVQANHVSISLTRQHSVG